MIDVDVVTVADGVEGLLDDGVRVADTLLLMVDDNVTVSVAVSDWVRVADVLEVMERVGVALAL